MLFPSTVAGGAAAEARYYLHGHVAASGIGCFLGSSGGAILQRHAMFVAYVQFSVCCEGLLGHGS